MTFCNKVHTRCGEAKPCVRIAAQIDHWPWPHTHEVQASHIRMKAQGQSVDHPAAFVARANEMKMTSNEDASASWQESSMDDSRTQPATISQDSLSNLLPTDTVDHHWEGDAGLEHVDAIQQEQNEMEQSARQKDEAVEPPKEPPNHHQQRPQERLYNCLLPSGQVMDAKNTVQSHSVLVVEPYPLVPHHHHHHQPTRGTGFFAGGTEKDHSVAVLPAMELSLQQPAEPSMMSALCVATTRAINGNVHDWDNPMIDSVVMAHAWNPDSGAAAAAADSVIAVAMVPDHHATVPSLYWPHCDGIPPPPSRSLLPSHFHFRPNWDETSGSMAPRSSLDGPSVPPRPLNMDPQDTSTGQPLPLRGPDGSKVTRGHRLSTRIKVGIAMVLVALVTVAATLILGACLKDGCRRHPSHANATGTVNATIATPNYSTVQNGSLAINSTFDATTWITAASNSTMASTLNRTERGILVAEFINGITLSERPIRLIPPNNSNQSTFAAAHAEMSAEERALQWLVYVDSSTLTPNTPAGSGQARLSQRYALATLWLQLGWTEQPLGPESECTWLSVACESVDLGPELGGFMGVVTGLFLGPDVTTNFTLPPDLGLLTSLTQVEVLFAPLVGLLPTTIGLWTNLNVFTVQSAGLSGPLPSTLEQWTALESFRIESTAISGSLPEWMGSWSALQIFSMRANLLTGKIPSAVQQWSNLLAFSVGQNSLTGSLPEWLGHWTKLGTFAVEENRLSGSIPSCIGNWTDMFAFSVGDNALHGSLPDSIGQRWSSLTIFNVSRNEIVGTIPSTVQSWTALEMFDVSHNALTGSLPEAIGKWTDMFEFDVDHNALTGPLPVSLSNWTGLFTARFYNNSLQGGFIPERWCSFVATIYADCPLKFSCDCCECSNQTGLGC
jgi:hypothetical protein